MSQNSYYSRNYVSINLLNDKSLLTGTVSAYFWLSFIGTVLIYKLHCKKSPIKYEFQMTASLIKIINSLTLFWMGLFLSCHGVQRGTKVEWNAG